MYRIGDEVAFDEQRTNSLYRSPHSNRPKWMRGTSGEVRTNRESVHLPWYKTQYWSGFIFGLWVGLLTGLPFAFVVYQIAKVVVHFIEGV